MVLVQEKRRYVPCSRHHAHLLQRNARFITYFAAFAKPLRPCSSQGDTFCIGQWAGESFQEFKQHLARASVLAYEDTRVVGDESPSGLGIVLV